MLKSAFIGLQLYCFLHSFSCCCLCEILRKFWLIAVRGHPWSSILVSIQSTCDFLLVINSNIKHNPTVFEISTFKARKWLVFPPLPCLTFPLGGGSPLEFLYEAYPSKTRGIWLTVRWKYQHPNFNRFDWNALPLDIRDVGGMKAFRQAVRTRYFSLAFNSPCWHGVRLDPRPSFFNKFSQLLA